MDKKEQYESPYIEIIKFETEDIITTSNDSNDTTNLPIITSNGELK